MWHTNPTKYLPSAQKERGKNISEDILATAKKQKPSISHDHHHYFISFILVSNLDLWHISSRHDRSYKFNAIFGEIVY